MNKLVVDYSRMNVFTFCGKVQTIIDGITSNNTIFPAPNPTMPQLQSLLDNLVNAAVAAESGDHQKIAVRNSYREVLADSVQLLGSYCENMAGGVLEKLLASGFDLAKTPEPIGPLAPVSQFTGYFTGIAGEVQLKWRGVYGAKTYIVQGRVAGNPQAPFQQIAICTRSRLTVQDLVPATWEFRVIAVGTAGQSAPSNIATIPVA